MTPATALALERIPTLHEGKLAVAVRDALSDDLRRAPYRYHLNPLRGHCYVASEALYHLLGGSQSNWTSETLTMPGGVHWYLRHIDGRVLDVTAGQFAKKPNYDHGVLRGFLTGYEKPSKRARELMRRVEFALGGEC